MSEYRAKLSKSKAASSTDISTNIADKRDLNGIDL